MEVLTNKAARWIYALPFGIFGILHFMNAQAMAGMVPLPGGSFWVYLTGLGMILACISVIINKQTRLAMLLLALMLIIFVLTIHLPGLIGAESPEAMQSSMSGLLKDTALAGGALLLAGQSENENTQPPLE